MKTGRLGLGDFLPKLGRSEGEFGVVEVVLVLVDLPLLLPNRLYRLLLTSALPVVVVVVDAVELPG